LETLSFVADKQQGQQNGGLAAFEPGEFFELVGVGGQGEVGCNFFHIFDCDLDEQVVVEDLKQPIELGLQLVHIDFIVPFLHTADGHHP
jgi:hypothetical protein